MLHVFQKSILADLQGRLVDKDPYGKHSSAKFALSRNMWMFFLFLPDNIHMVYLPLKTKVHNKKLQ